MQAEDLDAVSVSTQGVSDASTRTPQSRLPAPTYRSADSAQTLQGTITPLNGSVPPLRVSDTLPPLSSVNHTGTGRWEDLAGFDFTGPPDMDQSLPWMPDMLPDDPLGWLYQSNSEPNVENSFSWLM